MAKLFCSTLCGSPAFNRLFHKYGQERGHTVPLPANRKIIAQNFNRFFLRAHWTLDPAVRGRALARPYVVFLAEEFNDGDNLTMD